jgi:uncharacterized protein with FMN-binding domain
MNRSGITTQLLSLVFTSAILLSGCGLASKIEETKNLTIHTPDLSNISDGEYDGYYDGGPVQVRLVVQVTDHTISDIEILKHDCGKGKAAESIVDSILQAQSLDIDAISGATVSSKAILKAVEFALESKD